MKDLPRRRLRRNTARNDNNNKIAAITIVSGHLEDTKGTCGFDNDTPY